MLYLDYAKPLADGKYILSFFADKEADLADISNGKRFVTKNGIDYGVPQPSSTVVITMPDKTKKTYVLNEAGEWQEGGVDMDYSKLENAPITLANLADKDFVPEANTYYEHLGETTKDFIKGIIYFYDGKEYKAIDGSGSGGGVQSDYNQNDSTASDYIKNRPFYAEVKDITMPVYNGSLTSITVEGAEVAEFTPENVFELGEMVMLKIPSKGVDIITPVLKYEEVGLFYIGNIHILGFGDDTGEDYFIYTAEEDEQILGVVVMRTAFSNMEVGIDIKKTNEIVHKLDKIYLPDGMVTETYVDTAISNAITKTLNTEV